MPSLKSQLLFFTMRNSHLLKFRLKREAWDWNTSVPQFRQDCEDGAARFGKLPEGIEVKPALIEGLPQGLAAEWILPAGSESGKTIFYVHGGGYISGSCSDHRVAVSKIVKESGIKALLYEYRLAPEHPFPAALEDSLTAYRWVLSQGISPANIVIAGESAGGGLTLALLLELRDQGIPLPAAAVAISPMTDLKLTGESYRTKAKVCLSPKGMAMVCSKYYAGENDPGLPGISPLYGDLHGLPPILIVAGEDDTLLDDSTRFAAKAQAAGVKVNLILGKRMVHCYPLLAPLFPEAIQALQEICAFIQDAIRQEEKNAVVQPA
jgi:monoterpene epsilon-lactone hydrolase